MITYKPTFFPQEERIAGENILWMAGTILQINCSDYGITPLPTKRNMYGWYGQQGITGCLFLTNYRLFFKSEQKYNRLAGQFSIFLQSIVEVVNKPFFTMQEVYVKTFLNTCEFNFMGVHIPFLGLQRGQNIVDRIYSEIATYDKQNNQLVKYFVDTYPDYVYRQFQVNKKVDNFYVYMTAFLHPKVLFKPKNIISATRDNEKNKSCIGYLFYKELTSNN